MKETYACDNAAEIHYGITTATGENRFLTEDTPVATVQRLADYLRTEKTRLESAAENTITIRVYVRADSWAEWSRVVRVVNAAMEAGITDVVMNRPFDLSVENPPTQND